MLSMQRATAALPRLYTPHSPAASALLTTAAGADTAVAFAC
jgi:hypothetical protein